MICKIIWGWVQSSFTYLLDGWLAFPPTADLWEHLRSTYLILGPKSPSRLENKSRISSNGFTSEQSLNEEGWEERHLTRKKWVFLEAQEVRLRGECFAPPAPRSVNIGQFSGALILAWFHLVCPRGSLSPRDTFTARFCPLLPSPALL